MRFMLMHKNDPHTEAGLPPPMELVQKIPQDALVIRERRGLLSFHEFSQ